MRILVTGTAGFIGFHLARRLLDDGHEVTGLDGFTPYYDVRLKEARHALLAGRNGFHGHRLMLEDADGLGPIWSGSKFDAVVHLAAQAGVRYSIDCPRPYIDSNITGTFNLLELLRHNPVQHFLMASTSSVYGANSEMPFRETDRAVHPLTLYAATKLACEHMAHSYSHLFAIPTTAFRFFTVYGPWGRPDMALFKFTRAIIEDKPIDVYNHGQMERDFTYIDDLVEAIVRLIGLPPEAPGESRSRLDPKVQSLLSPAAAHRVINIGGGQPVPLMAFIEEIEKAIGKPSIRNMLGQQPGELVRTFAAAEALETLTGYRPSTPVSTGVKSFVEWYRSWHIA